MRWVSTRAMVAVTSAALVAAVVTGCTSGSATPASTRSSEPSAASTATGGVGAPSDPYPDGLPFSIGTGLTELPYWVTDLTGGPDALADAGWQVDQSATDAANGVTAFRTDAGATAVLSQQRVSDDLPKGDRAATLAVFTASGATASQVQELDLHFGSVVDPAATTPTVAFLGIGTQNADGGTSEISARVFTGPGILMTMRLTAPAGAGDTAIADLDSAWSAHTSIGVDAG